MTRALTVLFAVAFATASFAQGLPKGNPFQKRAAQSQRAQLQRGQAQRAQAIRGQFQRGQRGQALRGQAQLTPQQRAEILKRFDKNRDGRLDSRERAAAMSQFGGKQRNQVPNNFNGRNGQLTAKQRQIILRRFDVNKNGRLEPAELKRLREARTGRPQVAGKKPLDKKTNDNKPADKPAVVGKVTQGKPAAPNRRAPNPAVIKRFDENGNGRLDPAELQKLRALQQRGQGNGFFGPADPRQNRVDTVELLKRFDLNGDGRLSPSERAAALKK